jgi:transcriptional regulator with XRE-family HTH domain
MIKENEDLRTLIYEFIKERGISQSRLGKACGLTKGGIHNILKLRSPLSSDKQEAILEFLGIEFEIFLKKDKPLFKDDRDTQSPV